MKQDTAGDDVTPREPEEAAAAGSAESAPEDAGPSALEAERNELKDRLLRKQAEFENFRKRTDRERAEFVQFALGDCVKELLNVLDSFELALKDTGADEASRGIHRGYELIYKQLVESLQRFGLEVVEASGRAFDPHVHQAVSTQPTSEVDEGMVVQELRKGYLLKGRLLRPAMVTVAAPPEQDE